MQKTNKKMNKLLHVLYHMITDIHKPDIYKCMIDKPAYYIRNIHNMQLS